MGTVQRTLWDMPAEPEEEAVPTEWDLREEELRGIFLRDLSEVMPLDLRALIMGLIRDGKLTYHYLYSDWLCSRTGYDECDELSFREYVETFANRFRRMRELLDEDPSLSLRELIEILKFEEMEVIARMREGILSRLGSVHHVPQDFGLRKR
jgi:hypothetical protein